VQFVYPTARRSCGVAQVVVRRPGGKDSAHGGLRAIAREVTMNQRRLAILGVALASVFTAPAFARTGYRIVLVNGVTMVAADEPVRRGTILTFHQATSGALTGIPAEQVTLVELDTAPVRPRPRARTTLTAVVPEVVRPLEPGETLVIGATGDGLPTPASGQKASTAPNPGAGHGTVAYGGGNPAPYGGTSVPPSGAANATMNGSGPNGLPTAPSSTDLSQALASTTGANGFPANPTSSPTTIGPNGTPTLSPGMPGANTTTGPNGTPVTAGTSQPVIGPNGTPVVAQPATPGAASPNIGPNGTPTLAQPGAPGGTAPQIGPNGTPVLAPPGGPGTAQPNIGPNGTPNAPASSPHP
jgi:hypothetical protein